MSDALSALTTGNTLISSHPITPFTHPYDKPPHYISPPILLFLLLSRQVSDALSALTTGNTVASLDELATHLTFMQVHYPPPPPCVTPSTRPPLLSFFVITPLCIIQSIFIPFNTLC